MIMYMFLLITHKNIISSTAITVQQLIANVVLDIRTIQVTADIVSVLLHLSFTTFNHISLFADNLCTRDTSVLLCRLPFQ